MPAIRVVALLAAAVAGGATAQTPAWQDPSLPVERRAADLVGRMTLEEKVSQMMDRAPAIDRLAIPEYNWWNEGLHGVARSGLATVFPQAIGFAATWDDSLVFRMATVISGAKVHPMPIPATIRGARKLGQAESGCAISAIHPIPRANRVRPDIRMYLPPILSVSLPAAGATNTEMSEAGASASPAFSAENPRTDWR